MRTASIGWLVLAIGFTGCGDKQSARTSILEIRGEPIVQSVAASGSSNSVALVRTSVPVGKGVGDNAYPSVGFDKLAGYAIELPDDLLGPVTNDVAAVSARTEALIPTMVKGFNTKRVSLKGFMLPLKVEGGLVTELLIMKDQSMCCYGTVPRINEWVSIKMIGAGVKPVMDQPVTLFGTLHVGEMRENGYLVGIYRMDGERMAGPEEN
jgi:hypothetical protein